MIEIITLILKRNLVSSDTEKGMFRRTIEFSQTSFCETPKDLIHEP